MQALSGLEDEVHAVMYDVMRVLPQEFDLTEEDIAEVIEPGDSEDDTRENTFLDESSEHIMSDETFRRLMETPDFWQTSVAVNMVTQAVTSEWQTEMQDAIEEDVRPEATPQQLKVLRAMR